MKRGVPAILTAATMAALSGGALGGEAPPAASPAPRTRQRRQVRSGLRITTYQGPQFRGDGRDAVRQDMAHAKRRRKVARAGKLALVVGEPISTRPPNRTLGAINGPAAARAEVQRKKARRDRRQAARNEARLVVVVARGTRRQLKALP